MEADTAEGMPEASMAEVVDHGVRSQQKATMNAMTPEVELLGEYFPALRNVRLLYTHEVVNLLESGRGRLAKKFGWVPPAQRHTFRLCPGQGVQLYVEARPPHPLYCPGEPSRAAMVHAVLLYRGLDGEYCFFDSNFSIAPTSEVLAAVTRSGAAPIYWRGVQYGVQGVGLNTCQYYCLAFMSFVAQNRHLPTRWLIGEFVDSMRPQGDLKAVLVSQEVFDEAGIIKDLEGAGTPVHAFATPAPSRRQRGRRRPAERRRVVSKYLKALTRAQVRALLKDGSVSVVPR